MFTEYDVKSRGYHVALRDYTVDGEEELEDKADEEKDDAEDDEEDEGEDDDEEDKKSPDGSERQEAW